MLDALRTSLIGLLASKKAIMAVATFVATVVAHVVADVDVQTLAIAIAPIVAQILGQGLADAGKEAAATELDTALVQNPQNPAVKAK